MKTDFHEISLNLAAHPLTWGLARLARRFGPIWKVPGLGVLVSDSEYAREVLRRDDDFTKNGPGSFSAGMTAGLGPMALSNMDGADHRRLRAGISDALSPARVDALVAGRSDDLAGMSARVGGGARVDLVRFIRGWSGLIAFDFSGIAPPAGHEEQASQDIVMLSEHMAAMLGFRRPSNKQVRLARADRDRIGEYFAAGYREPAPEFTLAGRLQAAGFGFDQAIGLLVFFVMAGTLTVSAALPRIVALLVDHGLFGQLALNPDGIPAAIDEGLRIVTPLPATVRVARRDTEIRGRALSAGTRLLILTCNVARDGRLFSDPDRFDIRRPHNARARRPWYGAGPHRCIGLTLAQRELHAVLTALTGAAGNLRIVSRRPALGALLPAYERLVVESADHSTG